MKATNTTCDDLFSKCQNSFNDFSGFWQLPPIVVVVSLIEISRTRLVSALAVWKLSRTTFSKLKHFKSRTYFKKKKKKVILKYFVRTGSNVNRKNLAKCFEIITWVLKINRSEENISDIFVVVFVVFFKWWH